MQPTQGDIHARHLPDLRNLPAHLCPLPARAGMSDLSMIPTLNAPAQQLASRRLAHRGYLIHDLAIWYIVNDDYDQGLEQVKVGDWAGTAEDAYWLLIAHEWPTRPEDVFCPECREAEVRFGDICPTCSVQVVSEVRGESGYDIRSGR